jgi:hypothetical protein
MDDIGIGTPLADKAIHIKMVYDLFYILTTHGLYLKLSKSIFLQPQMDFLGVRISKDGIKVDPAKVAGLREYPRVLHNLKQVRGFLGCAGYHCMFCRNFSIIAAPLFHLTKKDTPFVWGKEQQNAQETIITLITHAPVLMRPNPSRQFELETDTSLIRTGAILYQHDPPMTLPDGTQKPGLRRPCGFHSQSFTLTE